MLIQVQTNLATGLNLSSLPTFSGQLNSICVEYKKGQLYNLKNVQLPSTVFHDVGKSRKMFNLCRDDRPRSSALLVIYVMFSCYLSILLRFSLHGRPRAVVPTIKLCVLPITKCNSIRGELYV